MRFNFRIITALFLLASMISSTLYASNGPGAYVCVQNQTSGPGAYVWVTVGSGSPTVLPNVLEAPTAFPISSDSTQVIVAIACC